MINLFGRIGENGQLLRGSGVRPDDGNEYFDIVLFKTDQNGNYYEYYLDTIVDGLMLPDTTKIDSLDFDARTTEWKASRALFVEAIEVTYNSIVYQGDEVAQGRISNAIAAAENDTETILWTAKNSIDYPLNRIDLKAILRLAGFKQSALWSVGRPIL